MAAIHAHAHLAPPPNQGGSPKLRLIHNAAFRRDPTRTTGIRAAFAREIKRRFRALERVIWESVVTRDCFGLRPLPHQIQIHSAGGMAPTLPRQYAFERTAAKVEEFNAWIKRQVDAGVVQIYRVPGGGRGKERAWTDTYIQSAYQEGIARAHAEMEKAGYTLPWEGHPAPVQAAFNQPFHIDRVGLAYSRTYQGLQGVTAQMEGKISHVIAQGLMEGRNPVEIARTLVRTIKRYTGDAVRLARTEVIRAHHVANINEMRNANIAGVKVQAEFSATGDDRMCPKCAGLDGKVYKDLKKAEGVIPVHPNCRCCMIPLDATDLEE